MNEVFPVVMGAVLGLVLSRVGSVRLRWIALVVLSIALGALASVISGETEVSLGFIPLDVLQVLVVAALTSAVVLAWQRRSMRA